MEKVLENFCQSFSKNFPKNFIIVVAFSIGVRRRKSQKYFGKSFPFFSKFFPKWSLSWRSCHQCGWRRVPDKSFGKNAFYERRSYGGNVSGACLLHMFEKTLRHRIVPLEPDERWDANTESSVGYVQCTRTKSLWPLGPSPSQRVHYAVPVVGLALRSCERYLTHHATRYAFTTAPKTAKRIGHRYHSIAYARVFGGKSHHTTMLFAPFSVVNNHGFSPPALRSRHHP